VDLRPTPPPTELPLDEESNPPLLSAPAAPAALPEHVIKQDTTAAPLTVTKTTKRPQQPKTKKPKDIVQIFSQLTQKETALRTNEVTGLRNSDNDAKFRTSEIPLSGESGGGDDSDGSEEKPARQGWKKPVFLKPSPVGFLGFLGFLSFLVFFGFLYICPEERVFRFFFQFQGYF
jgi:hypothetical protein